MSYNLVQLEKCSINEAILMSNMNVLKQMIKNKAKCEIDIYGQCPIHIAVGNMRTQVIKYLIQIGACLNTKDYAGNTPLMIACQHSSLPIVDLLINTRRCDIKLANSSGKTAFDIAKSNNSTDILNKLENCAYNQKLRYALLIKQGRFKCISHNMHQLVAEFI